MFIEVTHNGRRILINAAEIREIVATDSGAIIYMHIGLRIVTDSFEDLKHILKNA